jgi:hypothetical protein
MTTERTVQIAIVLSIIAIVCGIIAMVAFWSSWGADAFG